LLVGFGGGGGGAGGEGLERLGVDVGEGRVDEA